jgi:HD-like signal output (HDOD) protein
LYHRIVHELRDPNVDLMRIGDIIAQDQAMTAKILQLVNSAFFGLSRRICDPKDAVVQLGVEMIKSLVLAIHVFSEGQLNSNTKSEMTALHQHSLNVALFSRTIFELEEQPKGLVGTAFTAGLLHDMGRLVMLINFSDIWQQNAICASNHAVSLLDAEKAAFGVNHSEIGAYLLGIWGLPSALVDAAMFHHNPLPCARRGFSPLTAVHVANVIASNPQISLTNLQAQLDVKYLAEIGMSERVPVWWKALGSLHN